MVISKGHLKGLCVYLWISAKFPKLWIVGVRNLHILRDFKKMPGTVSGLNKRWPVGSFNSHTEDDSQAI